MSLHKIGFYGGGAGTQAQRQALLLLMQPFGGQVEGHHCDSPGGLCETFNSLCRSLGWRVVIHPAPASYRRAGCIGDVIEEPVHPDEQTRRLVLACTGLLVCPRGEQEDGQDRAWDVIRAAMAAGVPVTVVWPDGGVRVEG